MKIVHVTPHLGTGIGAAYAGLTAPMTDPNDLRHEILLLEPPQKPAYVERVEQNGVRVVCQPSRTAIERSFRNADIVQLNWWNHPIMSEFLYRFPDVPVRTIGWIHVSGCNYPYLRGDFLDKFDKVFFTTPYSYENEEVKNRLDKLKTTVLYGASDLNRFLDMKKKEHDDFRIGYVGTLDFCKLHPKFLSFCRAAFSVAQNIRFVLIGDTQNETEIRRQAKEYKIEDRIEFKGFCTNIVDELSELDCFGYPLNPFHFGATENALLEAMASGLPVIALNQNTEKHIIQNGRDGFLVENAEEFAAIVKRLYWDKELRKTVGKFAQNKIREQYSIKRIREKSIACYRSLLKIDKHLVRFDDLCGPNPSDWFLYFVQKGRKEIIDGRFTELEEIFKGKSKGSIRQFAAYFPDDAKLIRWTTGLDNTKKRSDAE